MSVVADESNDSSADVRFCATSQQSAKYLNHLELDEWLAMELNDRKAHLYVFGSLQSNR